MEERNFTYASYNQFLTEGRLMGVRCKACGALNAQPRAICAACHADDMEWVQFSGDGELAGYTSVFVGLTMMCEAGFSRENPYCAGVVRLAEGPSISAQIIGVDALHPETIKIGTPLKVAFAQCGSGEARRTFLAFEKQG